MDFVTERFEDTAVGRFVLAAHAFSGEVEREKIAERTLRGKAATARTGRLPQGTGRGIYGYQYEIGVGRRTVHPGQAETVRRIFDEFASGMAINAIARSLNDERIPTQQGKRWAPATIFHILKNETYTGRTIYRRTKSVRLRDAKTGRRVTRVIERDPSEWIEIPDATPRIVTPALFKAVQERLLDPERLRRGRRAASYPLAGRIRCRRCGAAMVGQMLGRRYRYYRCRRAFVSAPDRCDSRYVRADHLESALMREVTGALAAPHLVLHELERASKAAQSVPTDPSAQRAELLAIAQERSDLLVRYQAGALNDDQLVKGLRSLRVRETQAQAPTLSAPAELPDQAEITAICERIERWLRTCSPSDMELVASALQLQVLAETGSADISGVLAEYAPNFNHADVCSVVA
jgi:site-specific DNA recombinase